MVLRHLVVVTEHVRAVADQGRGVLEVGEVATEDRRHRLEVEAARELGAFQRSSAFIVTVPSFSSVARNPDRS